MKRWICAMLALLLLMGYACAEGTLTDVKAATQQLSTAIVEALIRNSLNNGYKGIDSAQGSARFYGVKNDTRGTSVRMYLDIKEQTLLRPWIVVEDGLTVLDEQSSNTLVREMARAVEALMYASENIEKEGYAYINYSMLPSDLSVSIQYQDYYAQTVETTDGSWDMSFFASQGSDGAWIRDELNVIYRFRQQGNAGKYLSTISMITDQQDVWAIASTMQANGIVLQESITDWIERHGKVSTAEVREETEEEVMQVRIRESGNVNVRQKSNADSARVGSAQAGAVYPCLSIAENGWYEIQLEDGKTGFISSKMATML